VGLLEVLSAVVSTDGLSALWCVYMMRVPIYVAFGKVRYAIEGRVSLIIAFRRLIGADTNDALPGEGTEVFIKVHSRADQEWEMHLLLCPDTPFTKMFIVSSSPVEPMELTLEILDERRMAVAGCGCDFGGCRVFVCRL
jgi:hypothetical protein